MNPDVLAEVKALAAGMRALAGVFILFVSYFNVRISLCISHFQGIFMDLLGGKELPLLTTFLIQARPVLILSSLALPLASVLVLWLVKSHRSALFTGAVLMALTVVQAHLTWTGLLLPLISICQQLTGAE